MKNDSFSTKKIRDIVHFYGGRNFLSFLRDSLLIPLKAEFCKWRESRGPFDSSKSRILQMKGIKTAS
jgi:hypothetical protein